MNSESKKALDYLTSEVFTGGNSILEIEAKECGNIIGKDLDKLDKVVSYLNRWDQLLAKDCINSKAMVRNDIQYLLKVVLGE